MNMLVPATNQLKKKDAAKIFVTENISCISKIELPHYTVCIHCGGQGNVRTLDNAEDNSEYYPKCKVGCSAEANVIRRKRKSVTTSDLNKFKCFNKRFCEFFKIILKLIFHFSLGCGH